VRRRRTTREEREKAPRAVIYARYSPRPDEKSCPSIDNQLAWCHEYAAKNGYDVMDEYYDEGVSGEVFERPGLTELLEDLPRKTDVIVWRQDRLARDLRIQETVEYLVRKKRGKVCYVQCIAGGDSPEAIFARQLMGSFAQLERSLISRRTSEAVRMKRIAGWSHSSQIDYGFYGKKIKGRRLMIPYDPEMRVLQRICQLRAEGMGRINLVKTLNAEGYVMRNGRPFTPDWGKKLLKKIETNQMPYGIGFWDIMEWPNPTKNWLGAQQGADGKPKEVGPGRGTKVAT